MNSTSEERQKAINECERLRDKAQEQLNTLFDNPTQEDCVTPCWECGELPAHYESYYGLFFCEDCVDD